MECTIYELYNINCTLYHGLEAGVQLDEEGRLEGHREHAFLHHGAVNVVVLKLETFVFFPK